MRAEPLAIVGATAGVIMLLSSTGFHASVHKDRMDAVQQPATAKWSISAVRQEPIWRDMWKPSERKMEYRGSTGMLSLLSSSSNIPYALPQLPGQLPVPQQYNPHGMSAFHNFSGVGLRSNVKPVRPKAPRSARPPRTRRVK